MNTLTFGIDVGYEQGETLAHAVVVTSVGESASLMVGVVIPARKSPDGWVDTFFGFEADRFGVELVIGPFAVSLVFPKRVLLAETLHRRLNPR